MSNNIIYQDNQSTILLEENGKQSSGKKTRHIEVRCYLMMDNAKRGKACVAYCPTGDMLADFFTKPLQGSLFKKFQDQILNLGECSSQPESQECVGDHIIAGPDPGMNNKATTVISGVGMFTSTRLPNIT